MDETAKMELNPVIRVFCFFSSVASLFFAVAISAMFTNLLNVKERALRLVFWSKCSNM